jgi:transcriptional regulator with XRE-family HTH domain/tetratricopeptide (TPR) repeat protein
MKRREKLIAARKKRRLSQEEVATAVGVIRPTYSQWECGVTDPYPRNVNALCQFFEVEDPAELDLSGLIQTRVKRHIIPSDETTLVPTSITISSPEQLDSMAWFGKKLAHVLMTVEYYCSRPEACLELETVVGMELNTMPPHSEIAYALSRRQFLITLASLPTARILAMLQDRYATAQIEQFLSQCAASLTACWHLMRGSDYALVEEHLSTYLTLLASLARNTSSKYQKLAASLATQGYRLKGILALHRNSARERDASFQEAVQYAEIAQHPGLLVAALISLAYHKKDPREAEHLYRRALVYENGISPLQLSRLYAQLSVAYAQENREKEALHSFHEAQDVYPALPEQDSSFLYAEFSPFSLLLEQGRVYLALSYHQPTGQHPQQAWKIFAEGEERQTQPGISERIRYEIINYQAETALALRERDLCCAYMEQGAHGAETLRSAKRRKEILVTKSQALKVWPHEARVKAVKV